MERYKVFNKGLISPFQAMEYEIGKQYICDNFDANKNKSCSSGFYSTKIDGIPYSWDNSGSKEIYLCEVSGKKVEINQYKMRYEKIKILRKCTDEEIKTEALKVEGKLGYKLSEVIFPINPLSGKPKKVTKKDIENLNKWIPIWDSVKDSFWGSVGDSFWGSINGSVMDSVKDSVWGSIRDSVKDSVKDSFWGSFGDSFWAYISSLFPNIQNWEYVEHKKGVNPFQTCIDLWHSGFIASSDGKTYRLHSGKNMEVVYKIDKTEIV